MDHINSLYEGSRKKASAVIKHEKEMKKLNPSEQNVINKNNLKC